VSFAAEEAADELGREAVEEVEAEFFGFVTDGPARRRLGQPERRNHDDVSPEPDGDAEG
jgi:hypothetical protein